MFNRFMLLQTTNPIRLRTFFTSLLCLLTVLVNPHCSAAQSDEVRWVGTWACAPQLTERRNLPPTPGLSSNTLRQVVHVSIGGHRLRVHFSNAYGTGPVLMKSVHIALSAGRHSIQPATDRALMFQGEPSVNIPQGETVVSDAIDFELPALTDVTVTIWFGNTSTAVTGHPGSRTTSYVQPGNAVSEENLPDAVKTEHWYILTGIDVVADESSAAVVTLGDSITDGRGSTTDGNNRWPDNLARRLNTNQPTVSVAVINQGIGGNTVLKGGLGPTASSRFDRDVLDARGVRWLILFEGVNDIGGSRPDDSPMVATNLINAFDQFIDKAHAKEIRVYGATITPFGRSLYFNPAHEAARQTVNEWIRNGGRFDAVIDFDAAVRDPANPEKLLPAYDSGDHLHLSVTGYQRMADVINLQLFEPQSK